MSKQRNSSIVRPGVRVGILLALAAVIFALGAGPVVAQREYPIAEIQGSGNFSPLQGRKVRTTGVVTALYRTGFFIQTPDDKTDDDPLTSEGVFVFTRTPPPKDAMVGNLVSVTGTVEEFRPRNDLNTLPLTEIVLDQGRGALRVLATSQPLPHPIEITEKDFASNQIDQLERYEGMRVRVSLTVVSPTGGQVNIRASRAGSNGTFFGVVRGTPRPFREPGLDIFEYVFLRQDEKERLRAQFPRLPMFDGNPEKFRVESTAQPGSSVLDVAVRTEIDDLTGVLHYAFRNYTIFVDPDSKHTVAGSNTPNPMPVPVSGQLTVAAVNLENFFDDVNDPGMNEDVTTKDGFEARLKKISLAFRTVLRNPDVIAVSEAETLSGLKRLAARINEDTRSGGGDDPRYEAILLPGNDRRGINNGFLVKTSKVRVVEVEQLGKDERFRNARTGDDNFLNDRPPLMIRISVGEGDSQTYVTLIANHLRSFLGYYDPNQASNVRSKKRLQAEFLSSVVEGRLKADPLERLIVLGDLNFYQFPDGILDVTGIISGRPASKEEVMIFSPVSYTPPLVNLVDLIDRGQRYSYVFDGNAQVLDHILVSESLRRQVAGFGYARLNADFPEIFFNDPDRPERFSDHDPAVAYFTLQASDNN
ncbi:MAG TPA: hypothetical protein PKD24_07375 [Pyrinomonadaceae bacterium]|nr:hypothetical protein [Pyrinomonadaceae bacterium]